MVARAGALAPAVRFRGVVLSWLGNGRILGIDGWLYWLTRGWQAPRQPARVSSHIVGCGLTMR